MSDSIAITSGKGGVGKTTFAVNLAIAFKKLSEEIFLLDTDLGMANSHVLLGDNPPNTLADVLSGDKTIKDVVFKNKYGVNLISGGTASNNVLNIENKTLKYFKNFKKEAILFIQDKFILKDNNIKTIPNIKSKKFIIK